MTTRFTDELMNQGLAKRILTLVSEINVTREFERLQKERGLGNEKHRKEVGAYCLTFIIFVSEASNVIETYKCVVELGDEYRFIHFCTGF